MIDQISTENLPPEFSKVLYDNLSELYESEEDNGVISLVNKPLGNKMKEAILKIIESQPGIKAVELMVKLTVDAKGKIEYTEMDHSLKELINDGSIVEVEYILPSMDYRIKSLYFPKGTQVTVKTTEVKDSRWS